MATGTAALAQKLVSGKKVQLTSRAKMPKVPKKTSAKNKSASSKTKSSKPVEVRTKMADGSKRKVYKSGSGMTAEIEKMSKAGKTLESMARHFGKENKDISWYINFLKKNGRLPKSFSVKRESASK